MSPSAVRDSTTNNRFEDDLELSIVGLGAEYPINLVGPDSLEIVAERHYPESNA